MALVVPTISNIQRQQSSSSVLKISKDVSIEVISAKVKTQEEREFSHSRMDIVQVVNRLLSRYGYSVEWRSKWIEVVKQIAFTSLAWLDLLYSLALLILVSEDQVDLLGTLGDVGIVTVGPRFRYQVIMMATFIRLYLVIMQTMFLLDPGWWWLHEANAKFHLLTGTVEIHNEVAVRITTKLHRISGAVTLLLATVTTVQLWMVGSARAYPSGFCFTVLSITFQIYHSSLYFSLFYLLNQLCTLAFGQYTSQLEGMVQGGNYTALKLLVQLQQFSHLYILIQLVKIYLKRAYLTMVLCLFGLCIQLFYGAFYTEVKPEMKMALIVCLVAVIYLVNLASMHSGRVDAQAKTMSRQLYGVISVREAPKHEVDYRYSLELIKFFKCLDGTSIGLELMGTPINTGTIVTFTTVFFTVVAVVIQRFHFGK